MTKNEAASVAQLTDEQILDGVEEFADENMLVYHQAFIVRCVRALLAQAAPPAAPVQGDAEQAFADAMEGLQYGEEEARDAKSWFMAGWIDRGLAAPAAPATGESVAEPVAWMHTLDNTGGDKENEPIVHFSLHSEHSFGVPGEDFGAEFPITSVPLYATPPAAKSEADSQPGEMGAGGCAHGVDDGACKECYHASAQQDEREAYGNAIDDVIVQLRRVAVGGKPIGKTVAQNLLCLLRADSAQQVQADAGAVARCQCCGYLVTESEHRGCLRAAMSREQSGGGEQK